MSRWLVVTNFFAPDHAGIAIYATDFVRHLADEGHEVTVLTGFPFYPQWKKRPEDRRRLLAREPLGGATVLRGYTWVPRRVTGLGRIVHELTFGLFAALNLLRAGRYDRVVVFSPPLIGGVVGLIAGVLRSAPVTVNVQDLPIDAAGALGMLQPGLMLRVAGALERWVYRRADRVVSISRKMVTTLLAKGVAPARVGLVPNWIDVGAAGEPVPSGQARRRLGIPPGAFVVAYAGNLGVKQGVEELVALAALCRRDEKLRFVIAGDGAARAVIERRIHDLALGNTTILPFLPPAQYRELVADADVMFLAQRSGAGDNFFPSKLLGLMAQGCPVLVAADPGSELAEEVTARGCGVVVPYGEIAALHGALERLRTGPDLLRDLGQAGRAAVMTYDRSPVLRAWVEETERLKR